MPIETNGQLWIFNLSVGEADTSVCISPKGKVIIIDAVSPRKLTRLLSALGLKSSEEIDHLIITHPHNDHYSGVSGLLNNYEVRSVTLSPFEHFAGRPGYWKIIDRIELQGISPRFLSGYEQLFPDGSQGPMSTEQAFCLELLGPSNQMLTTLARADKLNPNHLSIITRLRWNKFKMVSAADAQMENWQHFDTEQMLRTPCSLLKAAHHGSANGTQFQRLEMLGPKYIYVSSDPNGKHKLPDSIGCETFLKYSGKNNVVALSMPVGSVKTIVEPSGKYRVYYFSEKKNEDVPLDKQNILSMETNLTNWLVLKEAAS